MGLRFHRFLLVAGQINLLLTVVFILSEEMREEHERITARCCPTDGAIPCCWMTANVNESGKQHGTGRKACIALCLTGIITLILMTFTLMSLSICYNQGFKEN